MIDPREWVVLVGKLMAKCRRYPDGTVNNPLTACISNLKTAKQVAKIVWDKNPDVHTIIVSTKAVETIKKEAEDDPSCVVCGNQYVVFYGTHLYYQKPHWLYGNWFPSTKVKYCMAAFRTKE